MRSSDQQKKTESATRLSSRQMRRFRGGGGEELKVNTVFHSEPAWMDDQREFMKIQGTIMAAEEQMAVENVAKGELLANKALRLPYPIP